MNQSKESTQEKCDKKDRGKNRVFGWIGHQIDSATGHIESFTDQFRGKVTPEAEILKDMDEDGRKASLDSFKTIGEGKPAGKKIKN